jgi:hypothetical protein
MGMYRECQAGARVFISEGRDKEKPVFNLSFNQCLRQISLSY